MSTRGLEAKGSLSIEVEDANAEENLIVIDAPGIEGHIIGRSDAGSSYVPDVDLAPFGAQQRGISRRHAAIVRRQGAIYVVDLGSMNGTFVNNKRLSPQSAHILADGDRLSLANLHMIVKQMRT
mgnify:CR=1 FL=1